MSAVALSIMSWVIQATAASSSRSSLSFSCAVQATGGYSDTGGCNDGHSNMQVCTRVPDLKLQQSLLRIGTDCLDACTSHKMKQRQNKVSILHV
jgi:hypothetical protein